MLYKAAAHILGTAQFWAVLFVSVPTCLLPRFIAMVIQKFYFPEDSDIIREEVYYLKNKRHQRDKETAKTNGGTEFSDTWWNGRWHRDDERPIIGTHSSRGSRLPESIITNNNTNQNNMAHSTFYQSPVETSTPELVALPYNERQH